MSEPTFRTAEISRISGATLRQIQNWDELGLVKPLTIKHVRTFPARRAFTVMLIAQLRAKGVTLQKIQRLPFSAHFQEIASCSKAWFFITDGEGFYLAETALDAIEILRRSTSATILIDLHKIRMRLGLNQVEV